MFYYSPGKNYLFFPIRCIDTCQYIYKVNNQIGHDFIFCHPCVRAWNNTLPLPKVSVVPWNTHHYVIVTKVIDLIIYWHRSLMTPSKQENQPLMIWKPLTASSLNLIACIFFSLYLKIHLQVWVFFYFMNETNWCVLTNLGLNVQIIVRCAPSLVETWKSRNEDLIKFTKQRNSYPWG